MTTNPKLCTANPVRRSAALRRESVHLPTRRATAEGERAATVLVVDGEEMVRYVVARYHERDGINVHPLGVRRAAVALMSFG